jgi:hypothetical protein
MDHAANQERINARDGVLCWTSVEVLGNREMVGSVATTFQTQLIDL